MEVLLDDVSCLGTDHLLNLDDSVLISRYFWIQIECLGTLGRCPIPASGSFGNGVH